jgi:catechol 2,3-dioxygenase-like lactoylglutathione lyase family enzyme
MAVAITHIALSVPDLQLAERRYRQVFDKKVVTRESRMENES